MFLHAFTQRRFAILTSSGLAGSAMTSRAIHQYTVQYDLKNCQLCTETVIFTIFRNFERNVRTLKTGKKCHKQETIKRFQYKNHKGVEKEKRKMGPTCDSNFCKKSNFHKCQDFKEDERRGIFEKFWSLSSWDERKIYVKNLINKVNKHFS